MRVVKCGKELVVSFHKHSQCTSGEPQRSGGESGAKRPGQLRPGSLFLVGSVQPIFSFKKLFDPQGRLPYVRSFNAPAPAPIRAGSVTSRPRCISQREAAGGRRPI